MQALREGNTRRAAAALGGIGESTFQEWLHEKVGFAAAVEKAEGECEAEMVSRVRRAALGDTWQAAAWWLERRRAADFGRKDQPPPGIVTVQMVDEDDWRGNGKERPAIARDTATKAS